MHECINAGQAICKCGVIGYKHENTKTQKEEIDRSHHRRKLYLKATNRFTMGRNVSCVPTLRIVDNINLWRETLSKFSWDLKLNESEH